MKTISKIKIAAMILMLVSVFVNAQTLSVNGKVWSGSGKDTIHYCPGTALSITFSGADSLVIGDTATTKSPFLLPSTKFKSGFTLIIYLVTNNQAVAVGYYYPIAYNVASTIGTDDVYCGQPATTWVHGIQDTIASVSWNTGIGFEYNDTANSSIYNGISQKTVATITLTNGCIVKDSAISTKILPNAKVCWATVDTSSAHNLVVWDTNGISHEGIDSLRLYFYNALNKWQQVGDESIKDTNRYFIDTLNNPNAVTVRYMILAVDSCSNIEDTISSPWHNTMYIANASGTFSWSGTGYLIENSSQPVLTYYLFRNDTLIDSVSGTQNKITDVHYNSGATYYVGAELNIDVCPLSPIAFGKKAGSFSSTLSHSNIVNKKVTGIDEVNGVSIKVFPNPTTDAITIMGITKGRLRLTDLTGRVLLDQEFAASKTISLSGFIPGTYMLQVADGANTINKKIIKL